MPPNNYQVQIQALAEQVRSLTDRLTAQEQRMAGHQHNGTDGHQVGLADLFGTMETLTAAPTGQPKSVYGQMKVVVTGGTTYLYVYDLTNAAWKKATLS